MIIIICNKYKKIKDEVGMGGPKSTQIRFVGIIESTIHPYACLLVSLTIILLLSYVINIIIMLVTRWSRSKRREFVPRTSDSVCKCRYTVILTLCMWEKSKGSQC